MRATRTCLLLVCAFLARAAPSLAQDSRPETQADELGKTLFTQPLHEILKPTLEEHCVHCHGESGDPEGDVDLKNLASSPASALDPELLRTLLRVIDNGEMPPSEEPALPSPKRAFIVDALKNSLLEAVKKSGVIPATPIRRMTRFQYSNAVEDLLKLSTVVFPLPERILRDHHGYFQPASRKMPDTVQVGCRPLGKSQLIEPRLGGVAPYPQDLRAEHGYDNRGDHLSMSPLLMESFLKLAGSILHSPDFTSTTCGIWEEFFASPTSDQEVAVEVRSRLRKFLTHAFRRVIDDALLDRYHAHVMSLIASGRSFTDSMKEAASAALASPRFLYLYDEAATESGNQQLDDFELASRLSFFLWGSLPDEELLAVAERGLLSDPQEMTRQIDRLLADRRLKRLCDSFPSQWLQLDRIISAVPDESKYPDFFFAKYRASMHMVLEPLLLFETVLIEDRSLLEFIHADFSYRSNRLQEWYGEQPNGKLGGPTVLDFQRVPVSDARQGGVITTAAVMTMTSGPDETKPITRGAWMASVIFNDPPKPPPANVPPLEKPSPAGAHGLTLRQRFQAHRERADCSGCHARIDPLGFALENYDPVGRWRDNYESGLEVDSSGVLFGKQAFRNVADFKQAILVEKRRFIQAFTEHLFSFALGRAVTTADSAAIEQIVTHVAAANYSMHTLIHEIIGSQPFTHKSSAGWVQSDNN